MGTLSEVDPTKPGELQSRCEALGAELAGHIEELDHPRRLVQARRVRGLPHDATRARGYARGVRLRRLWRRWQKYGWLRYDICVG